jgi:histidinol-phosphate aminotransferase
VRELTLIGARPVPSDANFVLFGGLADARAAWQGLLDRGVLVRDVGLPGHLRVSAGTEAETTAFLEAAAQVLPSLLEGPLPDKEDR